MSNDIAKLSEPATWELVDEKPSFLTFSSAELAQLQGFGFQPNVDFVMAAPPCAAFAKPAKARDA